MSADARTDLRTELQQTRPFASLEHEATISIARTAAILEHGIAEALRRHGITPTQFNVLRILRGAGAGGLCRNEVRDRLVAPVPDATRLLDRMVELGLVSRDRDLKDRRFVTTRITQRGRELLARLDDPMELLHRRRLGHLGAEKLRALIDLLAAVRTADASAAVQQHS
jgi:DNA-binding MarR family transcriptional regulator